MNTKSIFATFLAALAVSVGAPSVGATPAQDETNTSGMKQQAEGQNSPMMGGAGSPGGMGGGMMGGHMMGSHMMGGSARSGMMGMMGNCPMAMGMGMGLDRKTAMQMHGEMMRAMGDILTKYADKVQEPAAKQ